MEHKSDNKYVCKLCNPDWTPNSNDSVRTLSRGNGFAFVEQHLRHKHDGQYETSFLSKQTLLISKKAQNTYAWMEWIVAENRELSLLENEYLFS